MIDDATPTPGARTALVQTLVLAGLAILTYAQEFRAILTSAVRNSEAAHALAAPLLVALLLYLRRGPLAAALTRGSRWGVVLIVVGLLINAVATWPFGFGLARRLSLVVVLAGIIAAIAGRRVLTLASPALLILILAIPIGARLHGQLTAAAERITIQASLVALELLPGASLVVMEGRDMHFMSAAGPGTIALGEPYRWMGLVYAYLMIGVFVSFSRIRPRAALVLLALAAVPVVLFCNFVRIMVWGVASIEFHADPISGAPRAVAAVATLILAWALFALVAGVGSVVSPTVASKPGETRTAGEAS